MYRHRAQEMRHPSMIHLHTLPNGLTLIGESLPHFESVAFTLRVPAGSACDPPERYGLSSFLCEMMLRGAGKLDNRAFLEKIDRIGIDRSESVSPNFLVFNGAALTENFADALRLYADVIRRPRLPKNMMEASRMVLFQEVLSAKDDPSNQLMEKVKERFYGKTLGHDPDGDEESLVTITWRDVKGFYEKYVRPDGMILAVAGNFVWEKLVAETESLFGDWPAKNISPVEHAEPEPYEKYFHLDYDSQQTHISLVWETVPFSHPDRILAWAGISALSGGMSSRLFTEVREKRGLCYTVDASCHSMKDRAGVFCYAASGADTAQKTLDVMLAEIEKLRLGVYPEELAAMKARYKSSLVMQQESCGAWCGGMAGDFFHLGRVRTKEEIQQTVDELTLEAINAYLAEHPPAEIACGTLGRERLRFRK